MIEQNEVWAKFKNNGDSEKYRVEAICDSAVYLREKKLPTRLLLFCLLEGLSRKRKHMELALAVLHLCKLIRYCYFDHSDKLKAISLPMNSAPLLPRPIVKPKAKNSTLNQSEVN